ncbi:helix-turn-helix domain-containing protein [Marinobacter sp. bablab_jr015]|uniref:helix-turn-helix transcriptional regulator n=1 Tax=unclassified Marinobacter TaxID=83889 RepID=UPI0018F14F8F
MLPLDTSQYRLAKEIGVPAQRIGQIIAGKRSITAETDLRLCQRNRLTGSQNPSAAMTGSLSSLRR